jgi:protein O-GlcNAc transferase
MLGNLIRQLFRRGRAPTNSPLQAQVDAAALAHALELQKQARHDEAAAACRILLAREPLNTDALSLLAAAMCSRGDAREGSLHLRRVAELMPNSADAHLSLATVLAALGETDDSISHYRRALQLRPGAAEAWRDLAGLLQGLRRYDEAEACCRSALQAGIRSAALSRTLAQALFEQGRVDESIAEARASLSLDPGVAATHSDLVRMLNYIEAADPVSVWREHHAWDQRHARALALAAPAHGNTPDPARRLRVGYVSPYFRKHAMNFFFESTVKHHDRGNFDIVLYADVARPDDYSKRLQDFGAAWRRTVGMSDAELADAVREDAIDILVDLSGHTPHNRLLAFARRPAPVQVTWNGYPNTTGMSAMDYRITDAWCDPPGTTEHLHSETLVRLPAVFMTWQPPQGAPQPGKPPALEAGHVTYGSFNSCFKITPAVAALWSRVLDHVPGSRLLMLTIDSGVAEQRIRDLFARNGIAPERLEILPRIPHESFLEAHCRADIALDPFPYHGTTTTCFSLWMGLPVVVRSGTVHASRVGVSLLNSIGLPELVAASEDEYINIASRLASDIPGLARLRATLRERMLNSPLTDGREGARALERAYRTMWEDWCRSH